MIKKKTFFTKNQNSKVNFKIFAIDCFYHVFKSQHHLKLPHLKHMETILMEYVGYSKKKFMEP